MVSWWDIWITWWSTESVAREQLWGHPIWWWGRVGKVLQFFGAVLGAVDLIGPERFRNWGQQAYQRVTDARDQVALSRVRRRLEGRKRGLVSYLADDLEIAMGMQPWLEWGGGTWALDELLDEQSYKQLLHEIQESASVTHDCGERHNRPCSWQLKIVEDKVSSHVSESATERERLALGLPEPGTVFKLAFMASIFLLPLWILLPINFLSRLDPWVS